MSNEIELLLNIYETTNTILIQIYDARLHIQKIKYDINNLDNDYFEKNNLYSDLLEIDENYLANLTEQLSNYKNIVEDKLNNICVHEWTDDYIDITPELSQNICYCIKCEVTKR